MCALDLHIIDQISTCIYGADLYIQTSFIFVAHIYYTHRTVIYRHQIYIYCDRFIYTGLICVRGAIFTASVGFINLGLFPTLIAHPLNVRAGSVARS